jgi:probable phosphoglycerate mutase
VTDTTSGEPRQFRQHRFTPPPGACEILLVRHGESAPFIEGAAFATVDGHGDPELDPIGHVQAQHVAERLLNSGEAIAAVYVTSLRRTHQTAAPLLARLGIEPVVERELREVFLGEWEGGELRRRIIDRDPIALSLYESGRWDVIPGAEPDTDFRGRVRDSLTRIAAAHPDQLVVVVVHGGVIGQAMNIASNSNGFAFNGSDNGSITHIVITEKRWVVRCYNDTSHLTPTFSSRNEIPPPTGIRPNQITF